LAGQQRQMTEAQKQEELVGKGEKGNSMRRRRRAASNRRKKENRTEENRTVMVFETKRIEMRKAIGNGVPGRTNLIR
jgi:hypothetical protein